MFVSKKNNNLSIKAYKGDAKTLLAFDLHETELDSFAGFTIYCKPGSNLLITFIINYSLPPRMIMSKINKSLLTQALMRQYKN